MTKRILSIIPARGGSKGLPRKNILSLAGKPLVAWTIEASLDSKYITKTIVSSDDDEILDVSKKCGASVIKRPSDLASDSATSESVVSHALSVLQSRGEEFDIIALLQPTSPLRTSLDIDKAFEMMLQNRSNSVISIFEIDNKVLKSLKPNSDGYIEGVFNNQYPFMRRQDLPKVYMPNGAIYIINTNIFERLGSFMTDQTLGYVMSAEMSLDIDTKTDFQNVEKIIKNH